MMEGYAVVHNFLEDCVLDIGVFPLQPVYLLENMLIRQCLGAFNHILTVPNSLPSGVHKHEHLLVASQVAQHHFVAFLIIDVPHISFSGHVVIAILWVLNTDEVDDKRDWSEACVEVKQSCFSWNS